MVLKNLFTGQQWRNKHREQTFGHEERGGEGEMYGKSNMETYITICKIDSQQEFAVWLRKLKQGLCINQRGVMGEGNGREVQKGGDICIPMADSQRRQWCPTLVLLPGESQGGRSLVGCGLWGRTELDTTEVT